MCGGSSCKHKHARTSRGFTCFFVVFRRAFHMQSNLKIHQCGGCVVSPPLQLEESVESCEPRPITLQNWHDTVAVVAISPPTRHTPRPCCEPAGQRRAKCRLEHPPRTPPVPHARGWLVKRQTRAAGAGGCLTLGPHAPQAGPVARPPSRTSPAPADAADAGARRGWRVAGGARQGAHGPVHLLLGRPRQPKKPSTGPAGCAPQPPPPPQPQHPPARPAQRPVASCGNGVGRRRLRTERRRCAPGLVVGPRRATRGPSHLCGAQLPAVCCLLCSPPPPPRIRPLRHPKRSPCCCRSGLCF